MSFAGEIVPVTNLWNFMISENGNFENQEILHRINPNFERLSLDICSNDWQSFSRNDQKIREIF